MPTKPIGPTLVEQPRMVNGQLPELSLGSRLDSCLGGTKHIGSWTLCNLSLQTNSLHGTTAHLDAQVCFQDSQEPSPADPNLFLFLITLRSPEFRELCSHRGLTIAFPAKKPHGCTQPLMGHPLPLTLPAALLDSSPGNYPRGSVVFL